jgi:vacuolar-type H+-ATPase subunit E/Vma4
MKNDDKVGKAISDTHIKSVKKLTKNMIITPSQNDGYYLDNDLNNSAIKIKSIRKYKYKYEQSNTYVYEVDVIVDMRNARWFINNSYCTRYAKRYNGYYRRCILGAVSQELKYFGIDDCDVNMVISKIEYKEIG